MNWLRARPNHALALLLWISGAWIGWLVTAPALITVINWDQGAYIAQAAAPGGHWSEAPWNAHFAIAQVYQLGVFLTTALGGTIVDGYRLMDALAFGLAMAFIGDGARRLSGDRWLGALCAIAWATTWVNLLFLFTLEDNVLYLPAAAGLFWLIVARRDRWTWRESAYAGALAGLAALQSWQALYYLGPAGYAALLLSPRGKKLRSALAAVAGFFGTLFGWCVFLALTSDLMLLRLVRTMFSRPRGSFALSTPSAKFWTRITGLGAGWMATHTFMDSPPLSVSAETLGALTLGLLLSILIVCTLAAQRTGRWDLQLLALSLFLFTLVTPLYHDNSEWRYLVRFDFWPILLALLGAALLGVLARSPQAKALAMGALVVLIVWNARGAVEYGRHARRLHPSLRTWNALPHPEVAFYGRDGMSWFQFFRGIREVAPNACRYLLAFGEASEGWWNPDLMGSLLSELRAPVFLVGDTRVMRHSRYYTPPMVSAKGVEARHLAEPCAWVSRDAAQLLGWRY